MSQGKRQRLEERKVLLEQQINAAHDQLLGTVNDADKILLEKQIDVLEAKQKKVDEQISHLDPLPLRNDAPAGPRDPIPAAAISSKPSWQEKVRRLVKAVVGLAAMILPVVMGILLATPVNASFSVDAQYGPAPLAVQVTNQSQNAVRYHWDFGDGYQVDEDHPPVHVYAMPGSYTIRLLAWNTLNQIDDYSLMVNVADPSPTSTGTPSLMPTAPTPTTAAPTAAMPTLIAAISPTPSPSPVAASSSPLDGRVRIAGGDYPVINGSVEILHVEIFLIDDREVTRRAFRGFLAQPPAEWQGDVLARLSQNAAQPSDDLPMFEVWPEEAQLYCQSLGGSLSTRAQWLVAAGLDPRTGVVDLAVPHPLMSGASGNFGGILQELTPAGRFPANRVGLFDMIGNVAEWVLLENGDSLLMGGHLLSNDATTIEDFSEVITDIQQVDLRFVGFRCAYPEG